MRYLFPVLLLVCAVLLCACANPSTVSSAPPSSDLSGSITLPAQDAPDAARSDDSPAPLDAAQAQSPGVSAPTLSAGDFSEPPALTLSFKTPDGKARTAHAMSLSYSWTTLMPDGTAASLQACGMAPLDAKENLQAENVSLSCIDLDFSSCRAESVSVCCWPDGLDLETDADAQTVSVSIENGLASFQPLAGGHIYEIISRWQTAGEAHYCVWLVGAEI